jgi:hypothetical protein
MITTRGNLIDINGKTEWLLFHRLSKKIHPVDFLYTTDIFIQFPNFLFTISFLILIFTDSALWIKFTIPSCLYLFGQTMINFRFGVGFLKLLKIPMMAFPKLNFVIMAGTLITGFFYMGWWTLAVIPAYFLTMYVSITAVTSKDKKNYEAEWHKSHGSYEIFKNNAFLLAYKYYATEYHFTKETTPTNEESQNQDWLKPYTFMRVHWREIESYFNNRAKGYWRVYLQLTGDK